MSINVQGSASLPSYISARGENRYFFFAGPPPVGGWPAELVPLLRWQGQSSTTQVQRIVLQQLLRADGAVPVTLPTDMPAQLPTAQVWPTQPAGIVSGVVDLNYTGLPNVTAVWAIIRYGVGAYRREVLVDWPIGGCAFDVLADNVEVDAICPPTSESEGARTVLTASLSPGVLAGGRQQTPTFSQLAMAQVAQQMVRVPYGARRLGWLQASTGGNLFMGWWLGGSFFVSTFTTTQQSGMLEVPSFATGLSLACSSGTKLMQLVWELQL